MNLRRSRQLLLIPLLLGGLEALGQESDLGERLFRSGERAYNTKAYAEAMDTWNQVLQQAPASAFAPQALLRMARHRLEVEQQPEAALPMLERIKMEYMKTPWAAEALLLRGTTLAKRARNASDLRAATAELNRVVDLFPTHPAVQKARLHLGLAARTQGQWGRALQHFTEALRLDPNTAVAREAWLQAAETSDLMGDLNGCLRLLQNLRNQAPESPEAAEATWRIAVRVKHRIQKPAFRTEGPWPQGKQKWLKTPTFLAMGLSGEVFLYQNDLGRAFQIKGADLAPSGPPAPDARALLIGPGGLPWTVTKTHVVREEGVSAWTLPAGSTPSGACLDGWGNLWVSDAKNGALTVLGTDGAARSIPSPTAVALAPLPTGGAALASDANRSLLFLDANGQPRLTIPYGKDLPAPFRSIVALSSDPLGHVAALVDGDFEGVVLWGPDGTVLRQATYKALGINGRFRALALDRQGGLLLADRSNDVLIRLN